MRTQSNLGVFSVSFKLFLVFVFLLFLISANNNQADAAVIPPDEPACIFKQNSRNAIGVRDATPNQNVAIFTGFRQGTTTIQNGNCAGTEIGIKSAKSIAKLRMNGEGNKNGKIFIPSTSENRGFMQILDLNTCNTGNVRDVIYTDARPGNKRCIYQVINNEPPVAVARTSQTLGRAPVEILFSAVGSNDPDGNLPLTYDWSFSDDNSQQSGFVVSKIFNSAVNLTVTLKVTDSLGAMDESIVQIEILPPGPNELPVANFTNDGSAFAYDERVTFDATGSFDTDGVIDEYMWELGDGTLFSTTSPVIDHIYQASAGEEVIATLSVKDDKGGVSSPFTKKILLGPPGDLLVGIFTEPDPPVCVAPCQIDFTAAAASPDGEITSYRWVLGDGTIVNDLKMVSHIYNDVDPVGATLIVTDNMGRTKQANTLINVLGTDPVAEYSQSQRDGTLTVDFDASISGSPNGPITNYFWDFGDGNTLDTADPIVEHTYDGTTTFNFVDLTITDSTGAMDSHRELVVIDPLPAP